MSMIAELGRDVWAHDGAVRTIIGYDACSDYVSKSVKGGYLLTGTRTNDVQLHHRYIRVGDSQVDFIQLICGSDFLIDQPDEFDRYYYLQLVTSGRCEFLMNRQLVLVESGRCAGINPFGSLAARWDGLCDHVLVRLNRSALEQTLAEELDIDISEPIHFAPITISAHECRPVMALIDMLLRHSDTPDAFGTRRFGRQMERLVHLGALQCFPNNYSEMLRHGTSTMAPFYVRNAEEYLRAHCQSDVTLEDLARSTGVSTRSLFYGFRRWRNTTPMAYLKKVRLTRAREALRAGAKTGTSVTDIAMSVGYWHLSRFSSDYKARFGEPPSKTLRRGLLGPQNPVAEDTSAIS
ncbi:MAG TPA: helix-turn-helix transcriptional regulator [Allosphingosinicella sp.]|nr:helix-turn-helix transcriptional regulator [Allosphingosinicella sp.]